MTDANLANWRLEAQRISRQVHDDPADVVRWMGAIQAQDYLACLWAVGLRTRGGTEAAVEKALAERTIVRSHFMRNTVHLVPPEDLRWMMRLVAPRIRMIIDNISRAGKLGLDESVFAKSNEVIGNALAGGRQLTRPQLAKALEEAGIRTDGRLTLITQRAQTDGIVCHGLRRGAGYGLALLEEWLPPGRDLDGDEALAEFARRYFRSHGPATVQDYAWWSGLTLTDARAGVEMVKPELRQHILDGAEYWFGEPPPAKADPDSAFLLSNYDEYKVGYKDRSAVFDPAHAPKVRSPQNNILFVNTIAVGGEILGKWRRTKKKTAAVIEAELFGPVTARQRKRITEAARSYGEFLGMPVELTLSP
jgi:hypothetical protein